MNLSDASFKTLVFLLSRYFISLEDGKSISPYVMVDFSKSYVILRVHGRYDFEAKESSTLH